jgi:hypothetical protein
MGRGEECARGERGTRQETAADLRCRVTPFVGYFARILL